MSDDEREQTQQPAQDPSTNAQPTQHAVEKRPAPPMTLRFAELKESDSDGGDRK